MRHATIFLLAFLTFGCGAQELDPNITLRNADCPVGCECICADPTTTGPAGSSSGPVSSSASPSSGGVVSPTTGGSTPPATLAEAIESIGAVAEADDGESIWGQFPDGRRFRVRYPYPWDPNAPTPARVIFAFHACANSRASGQQWDSYHWPVNGSFMVVYPEAEDVCWRTDPNNPTDFYHVQRVIEGVEGWPFVADDVRRLTGWSGGTFMSQSVACHLGADVLVAGSGGMRYIDVNNDLTVMPASCAGPLDVWLHHGQADTQVPLEFGQEAVDMWASEMGCTNPVPSLEPLDYCSEPGISCGSSPGCVSYTCAQGSLRWCIDESDHSQQFTGAAARNVGEILFDI